jgi:hypothetical protein
VWAFAQFPKGGFDMFYVTMTDRFMSGWGHACGKINKFVVRCNNMNEAKTIALNARRRKEMKYVRIVYSMPKYSDQRYLVSLRRYEDLGDIWTCQCGGGA